MTCANLPARHGTWAAALAVAALVLTGACDSDGGGDAGPGASASPSVTGSRSAATDASPSLSASPTPTATAPEDPEGAERDIREAWRVLFDPGSSSQERSDVVEDGAENSLMIDNLFRDPAGRKLRAEVTSVSYTSDVRADVAYELTSDERPLNTGGPGAAVLQDGSWKVALRTVCGLTRHAEDAPEAPSCAVTPTPS